MYFTDLEVLKEIEALAPELKMHPNDIECILFSIMTTGDLGVWKTVISAAIDVAGSKRHHELGLEMAIDERLGEISLFCGSCGGECEAHSVLNGIGSYEFWGAKGVDTKMEIESICCDAGVFTNANLNCDAENNDID